MKAWNHYKIITIIAMLAISIFTLISNVQAQGDNPYNKIPTACPITYDLDLECQKRRILNPNDTCAIYKCPGAPTTSNPDEFRVLVSFFKNDIGVKSSQQFPVLINLVITTFLGFVSVYAIIMGIYIGAFKVAQTTNEEELQQYRKTLVTLILGFILAWSFILIMQVVASILGLGSLSELTLVGDDGGSTIIID